MAKILALFRRRSLLCAAKWHVATAGSVGESGEGRDDEGYKTWKESGDRSAGSAIIIARVFYLTTRPLDAHFTASLHRILGEHTRAKLSSIE